MCVGSPSRDKQCDFQHVHHCFDYSATKVSADRCCAAPSCRPSVSVLPLNNDIDITVTVCIEAPQAGDDAGAFHLKVLGPDLDQLAHFVKLSALQIIVCDTYCRFYNAKRVRTNQPTVAA